MKDKSKKKHRHSMKNNNNNNRRGMSVYKDLLDCWMSLPLRVHEDEVAAGECKTHTRTFVCVYSFDSMIHGW